jgi:hypothetical protein
MCHEIADIRLVGTRQNVCLWTMHNVDVDYAWVWVCDVRKWTGGRRLKTESLRSTGPEQPAHVIHIHERALELVETLQSRQPQ